MKKKLDKQALYSMVDWVDRATLDKVDYEWTKLFEENEPINPFKQAQLRDLLLSVFKPFLDDYNEAKADSEIKKIWNTTEENDDYKDGKALSEIIKKWDLSIREIPVWNDTDDSIIHHRVIESNLQTTESSNDALRLLTVQRKYHPIGSNSEGPEEMISFSSPSTYDNTIIEPGLIHTLITPQAPCALALIDFSQDFETFRKQYNHWKNLIAPSTTKDSKNRSKKQGRKSGPVIEIYSLKYLLLAQIGGTKEDFMALNDSEKFGSVSPAAIQPRLTTIEKLVLREQFNNKKRILKLSSNIVKQNNKK